MADYIFRELTLYDKKQYLDLLFEFTNYKYDISDEEFIKRYDSNKKIIVIYHNNQLIGAGTIYKLNKLHNNSISQIEDIIIAQNYRGSGLGKRLIDVLVKIGLDDFKSYKVILNCSDENISFYEKCGFVLSGNEMKYNNSI